MKQLKTLVLSLPFVLAAVGCSQDELLPDGGTGTSVPEGLHEVRVMFNMGTNSGIQTRATSRPVISSDDWQRVSNVRIYVFKSETESSDNSDYKYYTPHVQQADGTIKTQNYFYVSDFYKSDDWGTSSSGGEESKENPYDLETPVWGDDNQAEKNNEQHSYTIKPLLPEGYYKFLAIGRDDITETDHSNMVLFEPNWSYPTDYPKTFINKVRMSEDENFYFEPEQWDKETTLSDVAMYSNLYPETKELFCGLSQSIKVESSQGFSTSINLNRVVAGVLMYVQNVPGRLKAMADVYIPSNKPPYTPKKATSKGDSHTITYVGIAPLCYGYTIPLMGNEGEYFENTSFLLPLCVYDFNSEDDWKRDDSENQYYYKDEWGENNPSKENSVLAGNFAIPQPVPSQSMTIGKSDPYVAENSLYLVFYTSRNVSGVGLSMVPVYWIPIKCKYDYTYDDDTDDYTEPTEHTGDAYKFPIKANCFYSLGKKNYKTDENEPIDLKKHFDEGGEGGDNNLVITVNPDWDWKGDLEWAD